ncbi:MAG: transporter substrate-binding domain-containing protein, partial [Pseudobdellovibrionaceae bacterium]
MKFLFCVFYVLLFCITSKADQLVFKADKWCPYSCTPGTSAQGYMVDILKKVFKDKGHTVEYKIMPWAEAVKEAESGAINGIIGASVFDLPTAIRTEEPLGTNNECFFAKAESSFVYTGVESLKGKKIGTTKGYVYTDAVNDFLKANTAAVVASEGDYPLTENLKNLSSGKVDVV